MRRHPCGLELESRQSRLRTIAANRGVAVRPHELVRQHRRGIGCTIDVAVGGFATLGGIDLIPGDARRRTARDSGALLSTLGNDGKVSIEHALIEVDVERHQLLCFGHRAGG